MIMNIMEYNLLWEYDGEVKTLLSQILYHYATSSPTTILTITFNIKILDQLLNPKISRIDDFGYVFYF